MSERENLHKLRRIRTHEALRQVALKRFASEGFGKVTVQQLAREAVSPSAHFSGISRPKAVLFQDY